MTDELGSRGGFFGFGRSPLALDCTLALPVAGRPGNPETTAPPEPMNVGFTAPEPELTQVLVWLLAPLLLLALLRAPWRALVARQERMTALGVSIATLPLLWSMSPPLPGDIHLHLLGMTTVTLVFGWQLALLAGLLAGGVLVFVGNWALPALPINYLLTVAVPVLVSAVVLGSANRLRRTNLFVYMLGVGFFGSMAAIGATLAVGNHLLDTGLDHALVMLLTFPEGFVNGAIISALTVFYPELVRTYDDERYLGKPR